MIKTFFLTSVDDGNRKYNMEKCRTSNTVVYKGHAVNKSNNIRSRPGPGNAYFISIRQVSLPVHFRYFATY